MLSAQSIPHVTILAGIRYISLKNFYLFGFMLNKLTVPDKAIPD